MLRTQTAPELADVIGSHHDPGRLPSSLSCLVHLADNLCKDIGLGYNPEEESSYSPAVLIVSKKKREEIEGLQAKLGPAVVEDVKELVGRCMNSGS